MLLTYFILMSENIRVLSLVFFIISFVYLIVSVFENDGIDRTNEEDCKKAFRIVIISALLFTFTPTTKQAALIFLSGQEDVVTTVKNLPKLTKLGTDYLIELLEEGKKDDDN